ncbi:MAG: hypothetical protein H7A01_07820 [Hahellaceae bacterium]|nr:hypothetical protein [Hahellaceae bacterium]MCP5211626.1 hypothetical protein [Hahellaceae bacterium]
MSVKSNINNRIDQAKAFADKLRKAYHDAYEKALEATSEKVDDLRKVGEHLDADAVREAIATKVQAAHKIVDDLNRSLADKAVPAFRKRKNTPDVDQSASEQTPEELAVSKGKKEGASDVVPTKKPRAKRAAAKRAVPAPKSATTKQAAAARSRDPIKRKVSSKKLPSTPDSAN